MTTKSRQKLGSSAAVPARPHRLRAHDYFETMRQISEDPATLEAVKDAEIKHRETSKQSSAPGTPPRLT